MDYLGEFAFCLYGASESEIAQAESEIGKFLLRWQNLELNLRILVLRRGNFESPSLPLYDRGGRFVSAIRTAVLDHDKSLYDSLYRLNNFRNLIVHGVVQTLGAEDPQRRLVFVHQDVWAVQGIQEELREWESSFSSTISKEEENWVERISLHLYLSDLPKVRQELIEVNRNVQNLLAITKKGGYK